MKIGIVTDNFDSTDGWGKYSLEMVKSLAKVADVEVYCHRCGGIDGVDFYQIMPSVRKHPLHILLYAAVLCVALKDRDIVHCFVEPFAPVTAVACFLLRKPFILTAHGTYAVRPLVKGGIRGLLLKLAYKRATKILAVSNFTKNKILEYCKLENIEVVPNGVDYEKFQ